MKIMSDTQSIESANLLSSFKNAISFLSQTLGKALEEITKYGLEVEPVKVDKNHLEYIIDCGDLGELHVWADRQKEKDDDGNVLPYDMKMDFEGHKKSFGKHELDDMFDLVKKEFKSITGKDLKEVQDEVNKQVNSSTHIQASFKKIQCGKDVQVDMTSVMCSDNPSTALMVINDVLSDDDFIESIPVDEVVSFDIQDDGTQSIIDEIEEICAPVDSYELCRVCAAKLLDILHTIHFNARGKQFDRLHSNTESMLYDIRYQIDTLAEWSVQHFGYAKSNKEISNMYEFSVNPNGYTLDEAIPLMRQACNEYIDCLNLYYCNMSKVAQTTVDNWLEFLDKTANYKMARTEL